MPPECPGGLYSRNPRWLASYSARTFPRRAAPKRMRKRISAADLHDLLSREFRKTAADSCLACRIPMPAYFRGAREGPNWRIGAFEECSTLCHTIFEDVKARVAARYDLL